MISIKTIKNNLLQKKIKDHFSKALKNEPRSSIQDGYKLSLETILKEEFPVFLMSQLDNYIEKIKLINKTGFVAIDIGEKLENLMYDKNGNKSNNQIYIKTIASGDLKSIFKEGVRCLGNISSIATPPPETILKVSLTDTISPINSMVTMVSVLKNTSFLSAGMNPVDQTLILSIPKHLTKADILYWNKNTRTFNIKPEFIIGATPISKNSVVKNIILREESSPQPTLF